MFGWFKRKPKPPAPVCPVCKHRADWHNTYRCCTEVTKEYQNDKGVWYHYTTDCRCTLSRRDVELNIRKAKEKNEVLQTISA